MFNEVGKLSFWCPLYEVAEWSWHAVLWCPLYKMDAKLTGKPTTSQMVQFPGNVSAFIGSAILMTFNISIKVLESLWNSFCQKHFFDKYIKQNVICIFMYGS